MFNFTNDGLSLPLLRELIIVNVQVQTLEDVVVLVHGTDVLLNGGNERVDTLRREILQLTNVFDVHRLLRQLPVDGEVEFIDLNLFRWRDLEDNVLELRDKAVAFIN